MQGWISLHRKMLEWEWYGDINTCRLFIHLLLKANHKDNNWRGQLIKKGQLVTGRKVLAEETGLTERQIRTSLTRLKSTNEVTIKTTNKYSVITLVKYNDYQVTNINNDQQNDQQSVTQTTTNNNDNNIINKIYSLWNENKVGINHKKLTSEMAEAIQRKIKKYGFEKVKTAISRLCKAVHDPNYFYDTKWNLKGFMQQKNGLPKWLDEGQNWNDYCSKTKKKESTPTTSKVSDEARRKTLKFMERNGIKC